MARTETKVTVYDLDNNPHRMTHLNARDMLNHNGWTLTPIDRAAVAAAKVLEQEETKTAVVKVDTSAIEKELDGKTKAQMIAYAKETFNAKIDGRKSEAEVIAVILELAAAGPAASAEEEEADDDDETGDEGAEDAASE